MYWNINANCSNYNERTFVATEWHQFPHEGRGDVFSPPDSITSCPRSHHGKIREKALGNEWIYYFSGIKGKKERGAERAFVCCAWADHGLEWWLATFLHELPPWYQTELLFLSCLRFSRATCPIRPPFCPPRSQLIRGESSMTYIHLVPGIFILIEA